MLRAVGKAPTRVDLAGGTIDLWPIYNLLKYKATVNVGVDLPADVSVEVKGEGHFELISLDQDKQVVGPWCELSKPNQLPLLSYATTALWSADLPPLVIRTEAKSPAGAGLGGSSCLALTLVACLQRLRARLTGEAIMREERLVETAQNIESRIIKAPTGCQDYWGAARGALNIITFPETGEVCDTQSVEDISPLAEQMVLVYSGKSRASAINNWEIFKRVFDGDVALLEKLEQIGILAHRCGQAAKANAWDEVLSHSAEEWQLRTHLWPAIETPETKAISNAALAAGATLSRVCGAGGGGVMAVFAPLHSHAKLKAAVEQVGGTVLPSGITDYGLSVSIDD